MEHLHVQMFGDFSFREGENLISDLQNRTKKIWLLLLVAGLMLNLGACNPANAPQRTHSVIMG